MSRLVSLLVHRVTTVYNYCDKFTTIEYLFRVAGSKILPG